MTTEIAFCTNLCVVLREEMAKGPISLYSDQEFVKEKTRPLSGNECYGGSHECQAGVRQKTFPFQSEVVCQDSPLSTFTSKGHLPPRIWVYAELQSQSWSVLNYWRSGLWPDQSNSPRRENHNNTFLDKVFVSRGDQGSSSRCCYPYKGDFAYH